MCRMKCPEDLFVSVTSPCRPDCSIIENYSQCFTENRQINCTFSEGDYHPSKVKNQALKMNQVHVLMMYTDA
ncbi:hypothetical protein M9Y10_000794 [Tritrichomonas musculus]|mgnify:CR=1 FL=1|uniref:Uncharacterized protein n=1 Tax=Tritrichomonas musculus TaxID=1915356 RepID=A0ABR2L629_9EUKA